MKKIIILLFVNVITLHTYAQFKPNYDMPEYMLPAEYPIALNSAEEITIADFPKNYSGRIDLEVTHRGTYIKVFKLNVTETFHFEFFSTSPKNSGFEFYFADDNRKTILGYSTTHAVFAYPDEQSLQQYGSIAVYAPTYILLWCGARPPEEELPYYSIQFSKSNPSPTITWQTETTATGYRIDIYDVNGDVISSLYFDAQGNFIIPEKTLSLKDSEPFSFDASTLDLAENSTFYYTITALSDSGETQIKEGVFKTGEKTDPPVGIQTLPATSAQPVTYYNLLGQKLPQAPEKGMYMVKYSDGRVEKVVK